MSIQMPIGGLSKRTAISYPVEYGIIKNQSVSDTFARTSLNPTNAVALYSTAAVGSGTSTIGNFDRLNMVTSTASNDNCSCRTNINFVRSLRVPSKFDGRTQLEFFIVFNPTETANSQGFIGIINSAVALTALPTTTRHMGIYWDTSVSNNMKLSSANGTTQVPTDTSTAIQNTWYVLRILWNGTDSGIIELLDSSLTSISSVTVSNLGSSGPMALHFFVQTLTTAAKTLSIDDWIVYPS